MKSKILLFLIGFIVSQFAFSQVSIPSNTIAVNHYLGSANGFPANFRTNGNPRMSILSGNLTGNGPTTDGFIGIGDFDFFTPLNLLHQHLNFNRSNFHQFTNSFTGKKRL